MDGNTNRNSVCEGMDRPGVHIQNIQVRHVWPLRTLERSHPITDIASCVTAGLSPLADQTEAAARPADDRPSGPDG